MLIFGFYVRLGSQEVACAQDKTGERAEKCMTRGSVVGTVTKCYMDDQMKEDEMDGACLTFGEEETCIGGVW